MLHRKRIYQKAIVEKINKGGKFSLHLQDMQDHKVIATLCGRMRKARIILCVGDLVNIELSPYDLNKGRILWRN